MPSTAKNLNVIHTEQGIQKRRGRRSSFRPSAAIGSPPPYRQISSGQIRRSQLSNKYYYP
jgi:hypothetical protein